MKRRIYCGLTLCPLWRQLGALYDDDASWLKRTVGDRAQVIWSRLHSCRVGMWAIDDPKW